MKKATIGVILMFIFLVGITGFNCETPAREPVTAPWSLTAPLPKGTYEINKSGNLLRNTELGYFIDGKMILLTAEINDEYIRIYSAQFIKTAQKVIFKGEPRENNYLIDNLGSKYQSMNYGGDYAIPQSLQNEREYKGYADFKGRPPVGADTFFYYTWGLGDAPIKFTINKDNSLPPALLIGNLKQRLAEKFAPILYLHPDEVYEPKQVEILTDSAVVRNAKGNIKLDLRKLPQNLRLTEVGRLTDENLYLDFEQLKLTDGPDMYKLVYTKLLSPNYKPTIYARVTQESGKTVLQYWFFYFFNDWYNKFNHEGDWEQITLIFGTGDLQNILEKDIVPEIVAYSQHTKILEIAKSGTKRIWDEVTRLGSHPYVYIAKGSHANYFKVASPILLDPQSFPEWVDETSLSGKKVVPEELEKIMEKTKTDFVSYGKPILLSNITPWILFNGRWGEWTGKNSTQNGPESPIRHESWKQPLKWVDALSTERTLTK